MAAKSNSRGFTFDGFRVDLTQRLLQRRDDAFNAVRARMAAATGDRVALVRYLEALCSSSALSMPFWPQDPLFRPFAQDAQVGGLLKKLEARRAEWRSIATRASTRVPVPLHETSAR